MIASLCFRVSSNSNTLSLLTFSLASAFSSVLSSFDNLLHAVTVSLRYSVRVFARALISSNTAPSAPSKIEGADATDDDQDGGISDHEDAGSSLRRRYVGYGGLQDGHAERAP